jgi:hypothetical protein
MSFVKTAVILKKPLAVIGLLTAFLVVGITLSVNAVRGRGPDVFSGNPPNGAESDLVFKGDPPGTGGGAYMIGEDARVFEVISDNAVLVEIMHPTYWWYNPEVHGRSERTAKFLLPGDVAKVYFEDIRIADLRLKDMDRADVVRAGSWIRTSRPNSGPASEIDYSQNPWVIHADLIYVFKEKT